MSPSVLRFSSRTLLLIGAFLATVLLTFGFAKPASAHPDQVTQTIEVTAEGNELHVLWNAAPHDLDTLAIALGLVPDSRTFVYENGQMVPEESGQTEQQLLMENLDVLEAYLLESITAKVGAEECAGVFHGAEHLYEGHGARLTFTCPDSVEKAEITAVTLQDLGDGYEGRLMPAGSTVDHAHAHAHDHDHDHSHDHDHDHSHDHPHALLTYNGETPTMRVTFDDSGQVASASLASDSNLVLPIAAGVGALILIVGAVLVLRRRVNQQLSKE